jgi:toxin-antitoxin system PIN domain toxin
MRGLLDVNVLIALHDRSHVHHELALAWFLGHVEVGWASCPLTQNGALRVMSQQGYPASQALADLRRMFARSYADPLHAFWPDDISITDPRCFDFDRLHGHRQITDTYLLGLAVRRGGRLITLDARIVLAAVPGARPEHLVGLTQPSR